MQTLQCSAVSGWLYSTALLLLVLPTPIIQLWQPGALWRQYSAVLYFIALYIVVHCTLRYTSLYSAVRGYFSALQYSIRPLEAVLYSANTAPVHYSPV